MNALSAYIIATRECVTDKQRACCTFAERMNALQFPNARVDTQLANLWPERGDPWGPVNACVKAGITSEFSKVTVTGEGHTLTPGTHRVQLWRGVPFAAGVTGHTITVHVPPTGDLVMVFDSAVKDRAGNVRGPRHQLVDWSDYAKQAVGGLASCRLKEA